MLEVEPKELSRNEQLLLREENTRLRFLLDHKDKLLEELTSKIVDYQHADLDRQRLCMKKLGEAR